MRIPRATYLSVDLLGRFAVRATGGAEIRLVGRHAQALFTLLALTRRPRTREAIAADLWPDSMVSATGPLRQALYQVRGALASAGVDPDTILESDAETLGMRAGAIVRLDTAEFEDCTDDPGCSAERAVMLYTGDLAEGLGHECFAAERERLADRYEDALAVVATQRLATGDLDGARSAAERLITRDPLREEAHGVLIAVHGLTGSRSQVVRQYRRLQAHPRPRARRAAAARDRRDLSPGPRSHGDPLARGRRATGAGDGAQPRDRRGLTVPGPRRYDEAPAGGRGFAMLWGSASRYWMTMSSPAEPALSKMKSWTGVRSIR